MPLPEPQKTLTEVVEEVILTREEESVVSLPCALLQGQNLTLRYLTTTEFEMRTDMRTQKEEAETSEEANVKRLRFPPRAYAIAEFELACDAM